MQRFSFQRMLFSSLILVTSVALTPSKAQAYRDRECPVQVTNSTDKTIYQIHILPTGAENTHPNWKINHLNEPLYSGSSKVLTISTTPDAKFWNVYADFGDGVTYALDDNTDTFGIPRLNFKLSSYYCLESLYQWNFVNFIDYSRWLF